MQAFLQPTLLCLPLGKKAHPQCLAFRLLLGSPGSDALGYLALAARTEVSAQDGVVRRTAEQKSLVP